jgi:hypothetical protein
MVQPASALAGASAWTQRRLVHHGGTIEGGRAMLLMFPDSKVVVAMLANILADVGESDAQTIGALFIRN